MSKWDGNYEEGRSRVYIAVSSACHDRDRFDHWLFNNIGGSCNQKQCIEYPGGCLLSEEGFGCGPCIEKGLPCSWKDAYIIAVIAGELELAYGKAFEFFTKLLKDNIFREKLRGEYSRDPDPNDELHPVKIQARLYSANANSKKRGMKSGDETRSSKG
ncbi:hypothetical protein CC2G_002193 [Coprinopsis cinerea AmutBmut pab1-1]|nr:hypothetical protein CC2G_002193 [Coprinopsis cinerea AmutBmut pab1-1]